ncbi:MAG TPA: preprotein translocase subunit SecA [Candidatus Limnocylindrales bacterium]|nr:preprotein translocase subunit SecA [Candidatus Limnocylindrales bacterium]
MKNLISRFVDSNERELHRLRPIVEEINGLEDEFQALSDDEIRQRMTGLRAEILEDAAPSEPSEEELEQPLRERRRELRAAREKADTEHLQGVLDDALPEVFAAAREIARRKLGLRHFDVQLMGGMVLHQGKIAEMKTGEGKTNVAPLAAALNAMSGRGVHVVTVNDYLAKRDPQWMGPLFHGLGLTVGIIQHESSFIYDPEYRTSDERLLYLRPVPRAEAYAADVTYGTNNEFGFDYLRDNMVQDLAQRVQRGRYFAIVDEVDNILIDEARTPLIISGQAEESEDLYYQFARLVPRLSPRPEAEEEGGDYFVDLKEKAVSPTEEGVSRIEHLLGIDNLYDADPRLARHFDQALRAHALYQRDRDYIVKDGEIIIVDEFTGRQMPGRRWSEGLHQAIEAKEGLRVQRESVTLATITFQNYFRLYDKLAGMTGTAMTESEEFYKIYGLDAVAVPTHMPMIRDDAPDLVFRSEHAKFEAVIDEIEEMQEAGRPVLVGTVTVEKSEILSEMLHRRGVPHEVLNAKFHEKEAEIVTQAGRSRAVTISTNMAGRGTDIKLGGDPAGLASERLKRSGVNPAEASPEVYAQALETARAEAAEDHETVVGAGGLHIIGTERHDARRIDNQLRGRAGRQGDPGSSRFYLSLEDSLMKRFASDRVASLMERMGLDDETAIESRLVSRTVESAQSRVEGYNFDIRKRVVEFDDVINRQRETIYAERDKVLHNEDLTETVRDFLDDEIDALLDTHLAAEQPDDWDMEGLARALAGMGLEADGVSADGLWEIGGREAIRQHLDELVETALARKQEEIGPQNWPIVERLVLLRTIDSLWVEHLTELDDMRRAAGLRGYGGEDPLNAFRKIAFELYEELRGFIRGQVAHTILRVQVQVQPPPPPQATMDLPGPGQTGPGGADDRAAAAGADGGQRARVGAAPVTAAGGSGTAVMAGTSATSAAGGATEGTPATAGAAAAGDGGSALRGVRGVPGPIAQRSAVRLEAGGQVVAGSGPGASGASGPGGGPGHKLGRNEPCWCGSGLKYKKCHGR